MSTDSYFKPKELRGIEKFEARLMFPFELYFNFGSTFFLFPEFYIDWELDWKNVSFDWLWIHVGIQKIKKI